MKNFLIPSKMKVKSIRAETHDVKTYTIEIDDVAFKNFRPGQFNMLGLPGLGEAPISISSIIRDGSFEHTIRSVGRVTQYLDRLKTGDDIFLRGPYGRGWPIDDARDGDLLIAAGGLGLAPLRPVVQTILGEIHAFGRVVLIYAARDPVNMLYEKELEEWGKHIKVLLTVDEVPEGVKWPHSTGLITEFLDKTDINVANATAFICGPEIMMRFASRRLLQLGFSPAGLYVAIERNMRCGIGQCGHCQHGSKFVCKDGPVFLYRDVQKFPDGLL